MKIRATIRFQIPASSGSLGLRRAGSSPAGAGAEQGGGGTPATFQRTSHCFMSPRPVSRSFGVLQSLLLAEQARSTAALLKLIFTAFRSPRQASKELQSRLQEAQIPDPVQHGDPDMPMDERCQHTPGPKLHRSRKCSGASLPSPVPDRHVRPASKFAEVPEGGAAARAAQPGASSCCKKSLDELWGELGVT